jgi:hypothetical protein
MSPEVPVHAVIRRLAPAVTPRGAAVASRVAAAK